uniref:TIR domain-containing adapter molecule 1-like n=1 Tax=Astyanax mexicanus TaxID=7994 RepID=W5LSM5_ASTMX
MAKESRTLEKKQTLGTVYRANLNIASKPSSDRLSGITLLTEGHATEYQIMGNSIQPLSVNGNVLKSEASTAIKTSSNNSSKSTISESGNTDKNFRGAGASAGHQTMGISCQMSSSNANMLKSGANNTDEVQNTFSGPRDGENNFREAGAAEKRHIIASCNQPFSRNTTRLNAEANPANMDDSYPSSLRSSSTCTSYSLEISMSTTNDQNQSQPLPLQTPPESRNNQNKQMNLSVHSGETNQAASGGNFCSKSAQNPLQRCDSQPAELPKAKVSQCTDMPGNFQIVTSKNESTVEKAFSSITSSNGKTGAQPVLPSHPLTSRAGSAEYPMQNSEQLSSFSKEKANPEEEEDMFYAFVILHDQEDDEEAARLKARLEKISSTPGGTFAEDFANPGRSTFSCVEDAINNSAFTMLLLTANFNTRLNEMNADSAIMNSIVKIHKYNTVIPLVPRDNSLTNSEMPLVLRTKVQMKERDNAFELMAKRVLNPRKIQKQKQIWKQEQQVRKQQEKQRLLSEENRRHMDLIRETKRVQELERKLRELQLQQQHLSQPSAPQPQHFHPFSGQAQRFGSIQPECPDPAPAPPHYSGTGWAQPPSNIHIENAKYIIVGNNSTMTVGASGNNSDDED